MKRSKESAIFYYLSDLYSNREKLKFYHLDSKEAFQFFNENQQIYCNNQKILEEKILE